MPLYLGSDDQGTQASSLQDFAPTSSQKMDAAVREAWGESYGPVLTDVVRSRVLGGDSPRITAAEAEAIARERGGGAQITLKPRDWQYTRQQWETIVDRQREMAAVKDVRERTPWELGSVLRGGAMFGAGILDPINLATAFVPWTRSVSALRGVALTAETGATFGARTGARAVLGAADAGISTAVLEPLYFAGRQALGDDYDYYDSLANIAFGAAFGGVVVPGAGAIGDAFRARAGRADVPKVPEAERVGNAPEQPATAPLEGVPVSREVVDRIEAPTEPPKPSLTIREEVTDSYAGQTNAVLEAKVNGQVAGTLEYTVFDGRPEISMVEVSERFRRRGVGAELVKQLQRQFPGVPINWGMMTDDGAALRASLPKQIVGRSEIVQMRRDLEAAQSERGQLQQKADEFDTIENPTEEQRATYREWIQSVGDRWNELNDRIDQLENDLYGQSDSYELIDTADSGRFSTGEPTAAQRASQVEPETREAMLRTAVAQAVDGREIDVDAVFGTDPNIGDRTEADLIAAADRNFSPETQPLADFQASADVDARIAAAPKRLDLQAAEQALADADALLADVVRAGDEAFKYSRGTPVTETEAFKKWSNGNSLVEIGSGHEFKADEPVVVQALHGTTADFTIFDRSRSNIESDLGAGFYFTNNAGDVGSNYAGFGPDLTNKIEREAERLEQILEDDPSAEGIDDLAAEARRRAREKFAVNEGATMPVFVRFDNPVVIGGRRETVLDYIEKYNEELDEYGEPTGKLVDFIEALREVASDSRYDSADAEQAIADLFEAGVEEGIGASDLIQRLKSSEGLQYATDMESESGGDSATSEIIRRAFEQAGFDGFIDQTVNQKFGSQSEGARRFNKGMAGMDEETVHFIAFSPTQIKSATGNRGTFDPTNPDILYARGLTGATATDVLTTSVRNSFGAATDALLARGQIQIVATPADIPGGPHPLDVKAATAPDGTVYVVAENVSEAEARGIVLHEVGVHVGMQEMLGPEVFDDVLRQLDDAITRGESWAQAARAAVPADTPAGLVREEQLAYLVQNSPELPLVQRIIAAVRAWAFRTFEAARGVMTLTEADFRAMAVSALHHAARTDRMAGEVVPAYARGGDLSLWHGSPDPTWIDRGEAFDPSRTINAPSKYQFLTPRVNVAETYAGISEMQRWKAENGMGSAPAPTAGIRQFVLPKTAKLLKVKDVLKSAKTLGVEWSGSNPLETLLDAAKAQGYDAVQMEMDGGNVAILNPLILKRAELSAPKYSRGPIPEQGTTVEQELARYDRAVQRAKQYAGVLRAAADKLESDAQATAAMRAAMPDITDAEIADLLAGLRKQVAGMRGAVRSMRDAVTAEDRAAGSQFDAMLAADTLANNLEMAAVIEKRNAALNVAARMRISSFVGQFRSAKLDFEGFRALLVGSERKREGGRLSVDAEQKAFRGQWLGGLIADMERGGLMKLFRSGQFDREVSQALWNLGRDGVGNENLPPEAVKMAEIINKYQTDARNTRNRFGAWIRDLQGYIARQSHDMFRIREAGEQEWIRTVLPLLDIPKMQRLGLISETDPEGSLRFIYDDFAAGSHLKTPAAEDDLAAFGSGASLARRESASRVLYFKDGNAAHEYNVRFGNGRLAEQVLAGLDNAARSAGLLKVLGTNPADTVQRAFLEYAETLRGDPERRAKFLQKRGELENLLAQIDGSVNIPGSFTAAKWTAFSRAWISMAKLGGALISSITDLANYGAEMRFGQDRSLFGGVLDGIGALTRGRAKGERRDVLASLGVFHESTLGAVFARFDSPDLLGGKTSWFMQQFFKLNGLNWWTESLRDGYALSHSHYMARNASKAWDALPDSLRDMLSLYRIDAGKWELLRLAPLKMADGRAYMTPEGLRTVPVERMAEYIRSTGRQVNDATILNLQADLSNALRAMTIDRMHHAVIEPSARTRAFMLRGTQPGTVPGELLRYIGQFKSFPVALIQSTLGREVYGRGYDTIGQFLRSSATTGKGAGDMWALATFIALSMAMGYAAMSAKDLLRGRNPRPIDDRRTWMAAMVQGGGLGIYGDFLFGQYNRMGSSLVGSLAGPVAGVGDTVADLWTRMRNGDDVAAASFNAVLSNTPFMNLFYTRAALDYLILYEIQEALNPGYLRRMERRAQTEFGQTYYLPPSQVVR